jgi:fructose-bisphosphate aldolase/2-amino-3,7-dideoxy-D-threo-hept-6-ulosonate synthase
MDAGKALRMKRIFREDGKTLIIAMDRGGRGKDVPGLERPLETIRKVAEGGADAILVNPGIVMRFHEAIPRDLGIIMSIPMNPLYVELAARLGVHGVKTTFFGSLEDEELRKLGPVAIACQDWGIPFLAEIVPQDENGRLEPQAVKAAARMAAELGADFVKTAYPGSPEEFSEVVAKTFIPVVVLGGPKMDRDEEVLRTAKIVMETGGAGLCFGRNVFQHRNPKAMTRALARIVHEKASLEEALKELG